MSIVYPWNPFQDQIECRITDEVIKTNSSGERLELVPRYSPFFARDFHLRKQGSMTPLVLGVDYAFAYSFDRFINDKHRNVFGGVVLLKNFTNDVLVAEYDTLGSPFTLDVIKYGELVANVLTAPRYASWEDLIPDSVPVEWPNNPHDHPITDTYDYLDMMVALKSLLLVAMDKDPTNGEDTRTLLNQHMNNELGLAHTIDKETLDLDKVANVPMATNNDLTGASGNNTVSVAVLKEAFRRYSNGTLGL